MEPLTLEELREHEAHLAAVCEPDEDYPEDIVAKKALRAVRELIALREEQHKPPMTPRNAWEKCKVLEAKLNLLREHVDDLAARHQRLREAAQPFATAMYGAGLGHSDSLTVILAGEFTTEQVEALRAALEEVQ